MANIEKNLEQLVVNNLSTAKYRALQSAGGLNKDQIYEVNDMSWFTQAETNAKIDEKIQEALSGTLKSVTWADIEGKPNMSEYATVVNVRALMDSLVDGAEGTLDTLKEIGTALNNDPDFHGTIVQALAKKANSADMTQQLSLKANKEELAKKASVKVVTWKD